MLLQLFENNTRPITERLSRLSKAHCSAGNDCLCHLAITSLNCPNYAQTPRRPEVQQLQSELHTALMLDSITQLLF